MIRLLTLVLLLATTYLVGAQLDARVRNAMSVKLHLETIGTLLAWRRGPDPNSYYSTYWYGSPFPHELWGHGWNHSRDHKERKAVNSQLVASAFIVAWAVVPAAAVLAMGLVGWIGGVGLTRTERRTAALVLGVCGCGVGGLVGAGLATWSMGWANRTWAPWPGGAGEELYLFVRRMIVASDWGKPNWTFYRQMTTGGMICGAVLGALAPWLGREVRRLTAGRPERWLLLACLAHSAVVVRVLLERLRNYSPLEFSLTVLIGPAAILAGIATARLRGVRLNRWAVYATVLCVCAVAYFQWRVFLVPLVRF